MLPPLRKKLLFRAWHRGTREADLLMGRFAEEHLLLFTDEETDTFAALLEESDPDIYDWITARIALPDNHLKPLLQKMMAFYQLAA